MQEYNIITKKLLLVIGIVYSYSNLLVWGRVAFFSFRVINTCNSYNFFFFYKKKEKKFLPTPILSLNIVIYPPTDQLLMMIRASYFQLRTIVSTKWQKHQVEIDANICFYPTEQDFHLV